MIYQLTGKIIDSQISFVVIDVGGVGFGVNVPERISSQMLPEEEVTLFTVTILRQDEVSLYGFLSHMDRQFFNMLLNIPRIGPKGALKILSSISSVEIMRSILTGDKKKLTRISGIGAKAAQRLILELQEKVTHLLDTAKEDELTEDSFEEAVDVLVGLGCSQGEARELLAKVRDDSGGKTFSFEDMLDRVLKIMADSQGEK